MNQIAEDEHKNSASLARDLLATYKESEDLINIGAYVKGSNKKIDMSIAYIDKVNDFLKQMVNENIPFENSKKVLSNMFN